MDVPVTNPQENGQKISSPADIMARRLKNRERQRRYRERKRLQKDTTKVLDINQLASVQVEVPVSVAPQDSVLPANDAYLDSTMPVNVDPLCFAMPANVAAQEFAMPTNVAPREFAMPTNVAPQEFAMPVDVASGECVMPVSSTSRHAVTRVYSGRKWKSDARRAHALRLTEVNSNGSVSSDLASAGGSQAPSLPLVQQTDVALSNVISSPGTALENNGTPKSIASRRHWKAEARNKRS